MTLVKNNQQDAREFIPRTFSDIIDNFFNDTTSKVKFLPSVDIVEDEKGYEIQVALPGMKKEEMKIEFQEGKLTIAGERKIEKENTGKKYHALETQFGSFRRSFYLPDNVNSEGIGAEYIDGILKVNIPKDEKKATKTTIEVK